MAERQANQQRRFIETSDRGVLRRLDEHELTASAAEIPGVSSAYAVHGRDAVGALAVPGSRAASPAAIAPNRDRAVSVVFALGSIIAIVAIAFLVLG